MLRTFLTSIMLVSCFAYLCNLRAQINREHINTSFHILISRHDDTAPCCARRLVFICSSPLTWANQRFHSTQACSTCSPPTNECLVPDQRASKLLFMKHLGKRRNKHYITNHAPTSAIVSTVRSRLADPIFRGAAQPGLSSSARTNAHTLMWRIFWDCRSNYLTKLILRI
jgi:hypothetical protein